MRRRLAIKLVFSDVKTNASVALDNLLPLVNASGEISLESQAIERGSSIIDLVSQGEEILRSSSFLEAVPQMDAIVEAMDKVAQVRSPTSEV